VAYEDVVIERDGGVGIMMLNRPDKLNALRRQTFKEIEQACGEFESDPEVRAVVLTGSGNKAFCTGIDLEADGLPDTSISWDQHTGENATVLQRLWMLSKPLVTAVNGYALAAGCNLALVGDVTVASTSASFGEPEVRHGALSPLLLLPWLVHFKVANEMYLTGDRITAQRAYQVGLVNRVVPGPELREEAVGLAKRIALAPTYAVMLAKSTVRMTLDIQGFRAAQTAHRYVDTYLLASHGVAEKEALMARLEQEGIAAFLEARDGPYREGAIERSGGDGPRSREPLDLSGYPISP
jgi:enoyl-CoA hydratase/carnithine racemase